MRHQRSFDEFKKGFIDTLDAHSYIPVYSNFAEDAKTGKPLCILQIDMICRWRLSDGKVYFVEVPFTDKKEFDCLVSYLKRSADLLHKAILEDVSKPILKVEV